MTLFNQMNKRVVGVLAVLAATLVIGTAAFVVIQYSTAHTSASSEAADRARTANRIQDLQALEQLDEPTTQPAASTAVPVTTTRPIPTVVTIPPVKIAAPSRVKAPAAVPPGGALATCDVAPVQAGTTSGFQCRVQVGSQFQDPSLMLICTTSGTICQMSPMIIEGIVPGGTYTSTATFSVDAQTAPTETMSLQITANSKSVGTFHFKLLAHPSYVLPITWQVTCNPNSIVTTVGGPIQVTCNFHMVNYRGSIALMIMSPSEFLRTDAPGVIDFSGGDATITFNIFTAGMEPGQYSIPIVPFPGPGAPPGFVPSTENVNAHIDLQLTG